MMTITGETNQMALQRQTLIEQYRTIHNQQEYGKSGEHFRLHIQALIAELRPETILNYGCGQSRIHEQLNLLNAQFFRYDPGIEAISTLPVQQADFVINTDVLEHIPEIDLDDVLSDIRSISDNVFFNIATRPAKNVTLSNGQNPHCTIKTASEWESVLKSHFPIVKLVFDRPKHSCAFITWDSCLVEVIACLEEFSMVRDRLQKAEESYLTKIIKECGRFRKRVSKILGIAQTSVRTI